MEYTEPEIEGRAGCWNMNWTNTEIEEKTREEIIWTRIKYFIFATAWGEKSYWSRQLLLGKMVAAKARQSGTTLCTILNAGIGYIYQVRTGLMIFFKKFRISEHRMSLWTSTSNYVSRVKIEVWGQVSTQSNVLVVPISFFPLYC